jgi:hypothetical protein
MRLIDSFFVELLDGVWPVVAGGYVFDLPIAEALKLF